MELNYDQRKALRRMARGKTIRRSMWSDPVISKCIDRSKLTPPPDIKSLPYPDSMIAWCDWEAVAMSERATLNEYGQCLLDDLEVGHDT